MNNKPPPFEGLNIRIPVIIPVKGFGLYMPDAVLLSVDCI